MLKSYNHIDELDKATLTDDDEFLEDAAAFLRERGGYDKPMSSGQIFDNFMEHMRFQDSNEITALRDLEYAQSANLEGKQRFGRLMDAYDKVDDVSWRMVGDYAEAVARAPSTYLGLISGGTGKAASVAATQAAKLGIRKVLNGAIKQAGKAAVVEGAIGLGQGAVQGATRVEAGMKDESILARSLTTGVASAAGGGLLNFGVGALGGIGKVGKLDVGKAIPLSQRQADAAAELRAKADLASAEIAKKAAEKTKTVLKEAGADKVSKVKGVLNALDADDVAAGRKLKMGLSKSDSLTAALGPEVVDNIAAAAISVSDKLQLKEGDRITTGIFNLIRDGNLDEVKVVNDILKEHNITIDQFSLMYVSELSDAGKKLNTQSQIKRLLKDIDELHQAGMTAYTAKDAKDIVEKGVDATATQNILNKARDLDKLGIGLMTAQPATTMRNNIGGGFRMAVDATVRTMDNVIHKGVWSTMSDAQKKLSVEDSLTQQYGRAEAQNIMRSAETNPQILEDLYSKYARGSQGIFSGTGDVAKYVFNPYEGKVVRNLFEESFPEEGERLFRQAADIESRKGESAFAKVGRKVNILNTMSDNMFKQGVLAASISRSLKDKGLNLNEIIEQGKFNQIPQEVFEKAVKDAYEFSYQSNFRGESGLFAGIAKYGVKAQEKAPFIVSAFMPFPRFVANQLKFQYEHMPVIGLLDTVGSKTKFMERLPKQLAGTSALTAAYMWRVEQGPEAEWFEIKRDGDKYINGKAIYGPIAPFMVVADMIYRTQNGTLPPSISKYYGRAVIEATLGSTFRTGLGLAGIESLFNGNISNLAVDDFSEALGTFLGRHTIPAGVAKDLYSQFDPQSKLVPATRTGEENWFDYLYKATTRNLPDVPLASWTGLKTMDYDTPAVSPFMTGPLTAVSPIEKQLFGATVTKKSPLMREMSRLGLVYPDLYAKDSDDKIDFYTRQELSRAGGAQNMNEVLTKIVQSDEYRRASQAEQIKFLKSTSTSLRESAKKVAKGRLKSEAARRGDPFSRVEIADWDKIPKGDKAIINQYYQEEFGTGNSIAEDKDLFIYQGDKKINVLTWALSVAPNIRSLDISKAR